MPEKDPNLWPWLTSAVISVAAATAQYAQRVRNGLRPEWKSFAVDTVICVFVGIVTHMICVASGVEGMWLSVMVAINSHMGTRAAMQWERLRDRILGLDTTGGKS